MEQKHNKQLHTGEYSIEYSDHEQQLINDVISGIFLKYSARYTWALGDGGLTDYIRGNFWKDSVHVPKWLGVNRWLIHFMNNKE